MQIRMRPLIHGTRLMIVRILVFVFILLPCASAVAFARPRPAQAGAGWKKLEISRTARPWEFLAAVGKRAGLLGNESGKVEAWIYPLKILPGLKPTVFTKGREIPAETLVRTVFAHPESTTLV